MYIQYFENNGETALHHLSHRRICYPTTALDATFGHGSTGTMRFPRHQHHHHGLVEIPHEHSTFRHGRRTSRREHGGRVIPPHPAESPPWWSPFALAASTLFDSPQGHGHHPSPGNGGASSTAASGSSSAYLRIHRWGATSSSSGWVCGWMEMWWGGARKEISHARPRVGPKRSRSLDLNPTRATREHRVRHYGAQARNRFCEKINKKRLPTHVVLTEGRLPPRCRFPLPFQLQLGLQS
jgi:hypothetical protein